MEAIPRRRPSTKAKSKNWCISHGEVNVGGILEAESGSRDGVALRSPEIGQPWDNVFVPDASERAFAVSARTGLGYH